MVDAGRRSLKVCPGCGEAVEDLGMEHCRACAAGSTRAHKYAPRKLKVCDVCGKQFRARSGRQTTCDECLGGEARGAGVRNRSASGAVRRAAAAGREAAQGDRVLCLEDRVEKMERQAARVARVMLLFRGLFAAVSAAGADGAGR